MAKYLKLFNNHKSYDDFTKTTDFILPNVSHCIEENEVHYNPYIDPRLIIKYNVIDVNNPTQLYTCSSEEGVTIDGATMFDKVEIDGTEVSISDLDTAQGQYQLSEGEHTVKYTLKDPTIIGLFGDPSDPSSVKIGAMVYGCETITAVEIPNSVKSIGNGAFYKCNSLTTVTIPNSVTSIGNSAFCECTSLTTVTIPNSVTSIGNSAFCECTSLTTVTIPNSVTTIDNFAFYKCSSLTSVTIGNGVTRIGQGAFKNCNSLTTVTIPNSVTSIDIGAFNGCTSLTSITIPNSVTSIGLAAFYDCINLTSVVSLATTAPTIDSNTFYGVKTNGTLTVPSGSSGYDVWIRNLGKYGWTKVEQ